MYVCKPEGPINGSLITFIKNPNDMNILFNPEHELNASCIDILCQNVIDIVERITEFMVNFDNNVLICILLNDLILF